MKNLTYALSFMMTLMLTGNAALAAAPSDLSDQVKASEPTAQHLQIAEGEGDKKKPKEDGKKKNDGLSGEGSHSDEDDC